MSSISTPNSPSSATLVIVYCHPSEKDFTLFDHFPHRLSQLVRCSSEPHLFRCRGRGPSLISSTYGSGIAKVATRMPSKGCRYVWPSDGPVIQHKHSRSGEGRPNLAVNKEKLNATPDLHLNFASPLSLRAMSTSCEAKGRVLLAYSGGLGMFRIKL